MTHDELLERIVEWHQYAEGSISQVHSEFCISSKCKCYEYDSVTNEIYKALRAVVELHTGTGINNRCVTCLHGNKCETIQAIEKELE